jgi:hypothetical protein
MAPGSIIGAADLYVSDFGTHQIVANRFIQTTPVGSEVYVLDLEYWSVDFLYGFTQEPLAKTGLSDRVMISTQVTLAALNPNASGKIGSVTVS